MAETGGIIHGSGKSKWFKHRSLLYQAERSDHCATCPEKKIVTEIAKEMCCNDSGRHYDNIDWKVTE